MKHVCLLAVLLAFSAWADTLPDDYAAYEYVTIPRRSESPYYNYVDSALSWTGVGKVAFRSTTPVDSALPSKAFHALATRGDNNNPAYPYISFNRDWAGRICVGGCSGVGSFTQGDDYPFDGSAHDFAVTNIQDSYSNHMLFGAASTGDDSAWTLKWYGVRFWDRSDVLVADFQPCRRKSDGAAGFYDTVRGGFYTRDNLSWPAFTAGGESSFAAVFVTSPAAGYGTLLPDGYLMTASGATQEFSLTGGVDNGDGFLAYVSADGLSRAYFERATVTIGETAATNFTTSFSATLTADAYVDWSFTNLQYRIVGEAAHGTVTIGTVTASMATNWYSVGEEILLTAIPSSGYAFSQWKGNDVTSDNFDDNPLLLTSDKARTLEAVFVRYDPERPGENVTWSSGEPTFGPNDYVTVPSGASVVLSNSTPHLSSFTVEGVVVVSNWTTCLDADEITVKSTGIIMAGTDGYILNDMTPNRVWIKGTDLTVEEGGVITADAAGYAGTNGPCWTAEVSRLLLGNGRNISPLGGAYGGEEGYYRDYWKNPSSSGYYPTTKPYGSAEWPYDPGSGGGALVRSGGGAVFLNFSGDVTVNGRVSADASKENYSGYPATDVSSGTGPDWVSINAPNGSGGGIVVNCRTIGGTGAVTANGVITANWYGGSGGGSGGRVAIHYTPSEQSNVSCRVSFESRGGISKPNSRGEYYGEPGTIWFSDNQFLDTYGTHWPFAGTWCSQVTPPASLAKTSLTVDGCLRFPEPIALAVTGDLAVTGTLSYAAVSGLRFGSNAVVTVGGDLKVENAVLGLDAGGSLAVAGDFTLVDSTTANKGAIVYLTAGATNGVDEAYGLTLDVTGHWGIGKNGVVAPACHSENGAIPALKANTFTLDADGVVLASQRGYLYGPGCETKRSGHGGLAGGSVAGTITYGDMAEPLEPGSGTGTSWLKCRGGGVVYLTVKDTGTINGKILADATDKTLHSDGAVHAYCGASGGSIYLRIKTLYAPATAVVRAMGAGNASTEGKYAEDGSLGGGGRVAIWTLLDYSEWELTDEIVAPAAPGGSATYLPTIGTYYEGTLPSTQIAVDATPQQYGTVTPPYGLSELAETGEDNTFDVERTLYDDGKRAVFLEEGHRIFPKSCTVSKDGVTATSSGVFPFTWKTPSSFTSINATWAFGDEQWSLVADAHGKGTLSLAGGEAQPAVTNWSAAGASVALTATAASGYVFSNWKGDGVTIRNMTSNPITVVSTNCAMTLEPVFYADDPSHVGTDVTCTDGKMPELGRGDRVSVPAGVTTVFDGPTPALASLVVDGTIIVSNWTTRIEANAITVKSTGAIRAGTDGFVLDSMIPNRVWLKGTTLTVEAGGVVSADAAGYAGTNGLAWTDVPRTIYSQFNGHNVCPYGGAYGGEQGYRWGSVKATGRDAQDVYPHTYGSAEWPTDPGSGGGPLVRSGGGAILLDFTGDVTLDGRVSADASTAESVWNTCEGAYGSGGGIAIACRTVSGSGSVSASSIALEKQSLYGKSEYLSGGGGGGRIAVHYDTTAQASADCRVTFAARGGQFHERRYGVFSAREGTCGTLWFSDNQFLEDSHYTEAHDYPFGGVWTGAVALAAVSFDGASQFTNGTFCLEGKTVTFGGDVTLDGPAGVAYSPCGLELRNCTTRVDGSVTVGKARLAVKGGTLEIAGDLVQRSTAADDIQKIYGGEFFVQAAPTNGLDGADGAAVTVAGTWTMESNSVTYVHCDPTNGAIAAFHTRDFHLAENAAVDARAHGYRCSRREPALSSYGPAVGTSNYGPGHYTRGGGKSEPTYASYDDYRQPRRPGSAANNEWGGGVICIEATKNMHLAGSLLAGSQNEFVSDLGAGAGGIYGGAGGSIYLRCRKLTGADTALLDASANKTEWASYEKNSTCGAGGCVAVWSQINCVKHWVGDASRVSVVANRHAEYEGAYPPEDGTVYWGVIPPPGLVILVR